MKNASVFLLSMVATAGMFFAGAHVDADAEKSKPTPLADPTGIAVIDGCEVTGRIEQRTNGVYLVFDASNPGAETRTVEFNYVARCTPGMSVMSRMVLMPRDIKRGAWCAELAAGESTHDEVLAQASTLNIKPVDSASTNTAELKLVVPEAMRPSPDVWTLTLSRGEVSGVGAFGASVPATPEGRIALTEGQITIARTVVKPPETEPNAG